MATGSLKISGGRRETMNRRVLERASQCWQRRAAPDVHPHKFSPAKDRERWDRDIGNFNSDLQQADQFFRDTLNGRLNDEERNKRFLSFFGLQGPWYTVGWKMAVLIETTFGRHQLIECMCDQRKLLVTYNEAARKHNSKAREPLALWSSKLIDALR